MDRRKDDACAACGQPVDVRNERAYAFGDEDILCWSCALDHGGLYDIERECWSTEPDVENAPDTRVPNS